MGASGRGLPELESAHLYRNPRINKDSTRRQTQTVRDLGLLLKTGSMSVLVGICFPMSFLDWTKAFTKWSVRFRRHS
jgi:hypothetical protein